MDPLLNDYVQTESMYSQNLAKRLNALNLDLVAIVNFWKMISILVQKNDLQLTSEACFVVDFIQDISYELLIPAFLNIMGWQNFEALVMGVATIFHEQESYHYHPGFLWKINKFVHFFVNWDVCVNATLPTDIPLDIEDDCFASATSQGTRIVHQRRKYVAVFHRKVIQKGNVQAVKVLIKWKTLPLTHGQGCLKGRVLL